MPILIDPPTNINNIIPKYGSLDIPFQKLSVKIKDITYIGFGHIVLFKDIYHLLHSDTIKNIRYLRSCGVEFKVATPIILAQENSRYRYSIPFFGYYKNEPIIFWRKESGGHFSGHTLLFMYNVTHLFHKVKKIGFKEWVNDIKISPIKLTTEEIKLLDQLKQIVISHKNIGDEELFKSIFHCIPIEIYKSNKVYVKTEHSRNSISFRSYLGWYKAKYKIKNLCPILEKYILGII